MSPQGGPAHPIIEGVTRSLASAGTATGVAYGLGLHPDLAVAVGGAVGFVNATGEGAEVLRRHLRGSPGKKELALRSVIRDYLYAMQELLSEPGNSLSKNPIFAERVKQYADEIGAYDEILSADLLSLNGALVIGSDFPAANADKIIRAALKKALDRAVSEIPDPGITVDEPGFFRRIFSRKKKNPVAKQR